MFRKLCLTAALVATCASAQAAIVTAEFREKNDALGSWELWVSALPEGGDTQGIASYAVSVVGLQSLGIVPNTVVWNQAPLSVTNLDFEAQGFGSVSQGAVGLNEYSAANTQLNSTNRIFGIGAEPVFVDHINPNAADVNTGVPALLGTLVVPGAPALTAANFNVGISLFGNPFMPGDASVAGNAQLTVIPAGGTTGPDLGPGGALDFGYNGQTQVITLTNAGDETANFLGEQFEITGASAGLFSLVDPNFDPIPAGGSRNFNVLFNSNSNAQASYSAALTFLTDAGVDPVFALTAQVPEPSTIALAGLGMVGLVGLARRRRK